MSDDIDFRRECDELAERIDLQFWTSAFRVALSIRLRETCRLCHEQFLLRSISIGAQDNVEGYERVCSEMREYPHLLLLAIFAEVAPWRCHALGGVTN